MESAHDGALMTDYEIISIFLGILVLLVSFGSSLIALLAFLDKISATDKATADKLKSAVAALFKSVLG